jgi:hypothetical protein
MAHPEALETYTRTIRTMSEVIENLRDKPDPDGSMTRLLDRITVEREWVRALMALGENPRRPPTWLRRTETATRWAGGRDAIEVLRGLLLRVRAGLVAPGK